MKNERYQPNNPTETRTISARTQGTQSSRRSGDNRPAPDTRILYPYKPAAAKSTRRSGTPRVDEVESRGWGRRAPQSPSSSSFGAPQGNNEIYTYDVVFLIEEAKINKSSKTPIPYNAPARSNKIYKSDEVFLIEEAKTNNPSQTSIPNKKTNDQSQTPVRAENARGQSGQVPIIAVPQV